MTHPTHAYNGTASQTPRTAAQGPTGPTAGISSHPKNRGSTPTASQTSLVSQQPVPHTSSGRNSGIGTRQFAPHDPSSSSHNVAVIGLRSALGWGVLKVRKNHTGSTFGFSNRSVMITYNGQYCFVEKDGKLVGWTSEEHNGGPGWIMAFIWGRVVKKADNYVFDSRTRRIYKPAVSANLRRS